MKILAFSDLHLDASTAGIPRWDDLCMALDEVYEAAVSEQVDLVIFAGDWCDPTPKASRCVAKAIGLAMRFADAGILSRWLIGNHCVQEDGHGSHVMLPLKEMGDGNSYEVRDEPDFEWINDVMFMWLPYTPRSHAYDPEAEVARMATSAGWNGPCVVVGHLNLEGIGPGSETTDMPRGRDVFWPLAALKEYLPDALLVSGHYHKRQTFKGVEIIGSLCRLTFGEEGDPKGWLIIEVGEDGKKETSDKPARKRAPRRAKRAAAADG